MNASASSDNCVDGHELPPNSLQHPGEILRQARQQAGLSLDDVSDVLRYSVRQLNSLEAGDFDALPGQVVVRGLIRAYARFLKLDEAALLATHADNNTTPHEAIAPPKNIGRVEPTRSATQRAGRWAIGTAGAIATVLAATYIFVGIEMDATQRQVQREASQRSSTGDPEQRPMASSNRLPAPVVIDQVRGELPPTGNVGVVSVEATNLGARPTAAGSAVTVEFSAKSWIEVRDGADQVLLMGEYDQGTRRELAGPKPISIWVGRADAVTASVDGARVDLLAPSRDGVSRVKVD